MNTQSCLQAGLFHQPHQVQSSHLGPSGPQAQKFFPAGEKRAMEWFERFRINPVPLLLQAPDPALIWQTRHQLLDESCHDQERLWQLPGLRRILNKQKQDGSWPRSGTQQHPAVNVGLIETYRNLRFLVQMYTLNRDHPQLAKAAEYIFSCQTETGDLRGILANQYATYYTGAILSLLIDAGYAQDARVQHGLQWLLSMRQDDLGWSIPMITHKLDRQTQYRLTTEMFPPVEPDRSKPFSHNWTGMVLRAFAAHPVYRKSKDIQYAACLLKSRFFQSDTYSSHKSADYWIWFDYPYWWNTLVSALDSISLIMPHRRDEQIQRALHWLHDHQSEDGLWQINYAGKSVLDTPRTVSKRYWITFAICRIFKRFELKTISA